mmetsp:Transcript_24845/g.82641  ORF Transcript_24845/g.82641 Transcript_24845/m.82641 type:complete len:290 (-) Transcript_24845:1848-2717(-)
MPQRHGGRQPPPDRSVAASEAVPCSLAPQIARAEFFHAGFGGSSLSRRPAAELLRYGRAAALPLAQRALPAHQPAGLVAALCRGGQPVRHPPHHTTEPTLSADSLWPAAKMLPGRPPLKRVRLNPDPRAPAAAGASAHSAAGSSGRAKDSADARRSPAQRRRRRGERPAVSATRPICRQTGRLSRAVRTCGPSATPTRPCAAAATRTPTASPSPPPTRTATTTSRRPRRPPRWPSCAAAAATVPSGATAPPRRSSSSRRSRTSGSARWTASTCRRPSTLRAWCGSTTPG